MPQCVLTIRCPSGTAGIFCESIISKCTGTSPCHKGTCTLRAFKKGMHGQYSKANYSFIYFQSCCVHITFNVMRVIIILLL